MKGSFRTTPNASSPSSSRAGGRSRASTGAGFTLMEIVVTLFIIGIMAAVTVPAFLSDPEPGELERAVAQVEAALRLARDSAVRAADPVTLVIDSASARAWLATPARPTRAGVPLSFPLGIRMQLTSARSEFVFQPGGSAFPDSVYLIGAEGTALVTVNPMTGHAYVEP